MNLLQKRIQEASQKYYTDGTSDVTDEEFDKMLDRLKEEDPNSPLLSVGHGYTVDKDTTVGKRVIHKYGKAGSLDKCHNWNELSRAFIEESSPYHASLKLDGLSIVLYYEKGDLVQALTRGGGEAGIDVTPKISVILKDDVHLKDVSFTGAVRGEIVMSYKSFSTYQAIHPEAKNARNTAAGIMNSKEASKDDLSLLDIVVYTIVGIQPVMHIPEPYTYSDAWKWLEYNFMHVAPHALMILESDTFMSTMEDLQAAWYGNYPADGIVLSKDILELAPAVAADGYSVIYPAIAFKFKAESAATRIIGIDWRLTKTKYLVPRINVETVQLSGTNVSWATGFNAQNVKDRQLGVGAKISILKSGEIIPYIQGVIQPVTCELPTRCPCCGTSLVWSGVHLQCPNMECADRDIRDAVVWMNNIAPWDGLGDILKLKFLGEMFGECISIEKIYEHGPFEDSEVSTSLVKKTEFRKMFNSLFTNKVPLSSALQALNIPRFGEVTSAKAAKYPEIILDAMEGKTFQTDKLRLGNANFDSMVEHIDAFKRLNLIKDQIIWNVSEEVETKGKVAITGKLSVKRSVFEDELKQAGYVPGNISKDTMFLITDDPNSNSSKNVKADEWGIIKIAESEFRNKYM